MTSELQKEINDLYRKYGYPRENSIDFLMALEGTYVEDFIASVAWASVSRHNFLSQEFIIKFIDHLDLVDLKYDQHLSAETVEAILPTLLKEPYTTIATLSRRWPLTEKTISKNADEVDWRFISRNSKLSEEFIEKHKDKVIWKEINFSQDLSLGFRKKYSRFLESEEIEEEKIIENIRNRITVFKSKTKPVKMEDNPTSIISNIRKRFKVIKNENI